MKPVILNQRQWRAIRDEIHKEHPKSVLMLRNKMRATLGFTMREHHAWKVNESFAEQSCRGEDTAKGWYQDEIHLDFYSENKRTMFLLKYSELINNNLSNPL